MTGAEAMACLDLLRELPDPWADEWDWLLGLAEDVGLEREDLAALSFLDAVVAVSNAERAWHGIGPYFTRDWQLRLVDRRDGDVRAALVQGMRLPLVAQRLPLSRLVEVAQEHFRVCPQTFRLVQVRPLHLEVPVPYLPEPVRVNCPGVVA